MPLFHSLIACVRKAARVSHAPLLCALLVALFVFAGCAANSAPSTASQGPQPETTVAAPTETATPTPLAHGGILEAAGLTPPVTVTPQSTDLLDFAPLDGTPTWQLTEGGPTPPFGPAPFAQTHETTPLGASVLARVANMEAARPPYKGPYYTNGDSPAPPHISTKPFGLANGWDATENFLIMGTDRKDGFGDWRTDSLMVVGLDRSTNSAAIFSIPRDMYVEIPGYGWGRINQADYLGELREKDGGPKLLGGIIEDTLGIPTDHWVRVHMDGFVPMIDALGGITITLETPFYDMWQSATTTQTLEMYLPAGVHHLNGRQTYLFSRLRYVGTDIGRASRQRTVLWALRDRLLSGGFLGQLPQLMETFRQTVSTDLGIFDIASLATVALQMDEEDVRSAGLQISDLLSYRTDHGAAVLALVDPAHVRAVVESAWSTGSATLAESFVGNGDIATYVTTAAPTEAITGTIAITVTPTLTGTQTVSATEPLSSTLPSEESAP